MRKVSWPRMTNFIVDFLGKNVVHCNDVSKIEQAGAILFREDQYKKNLYFNFVPAILGPVFGWFKIKCKSNNQSCLFHCVNTWMFEHLT